LSFETLESRLASDNLHYINCNDRTPPDIQNDIASTKGIDGRKIIIIDTLHPLIEAPNSNIAGFLSPLMSPTTSVIAVCHADIPFTIRSPYAPSPLELLTYLATTILTLHSLTHVIARKKARDKSQAEPVFGLEEGIPGLLIGMGSNDQRGTVVEMNHRRKSGRSIQEWFFVFNRDNLASQDILKKQGNKKGVADGIVLLNDHPEYPQSEVVESKRPGEGEVLSTFSLGITEKEKESRDKIALPYLDAQREGGVGEGGRILYDMGSEDDFDDEEEEI
jgi:elongator complex protein 5